MKLSILLMATAAFAGASLAGSDAHPSEDPPILAANLATLRIPGKIDGVLWTRRIRVYTLQVLIPAPRGSRPTVMPNVDAWLVRDDGSHIEPSGKLARDCPRLVRCAGAEAEFTFPLSVGHEAVAAAIRIDGDTRTERLTRFPD